MGNLILDNWLASGVDKHTWTENSAMDCSSYTTLNAHKWARDFIQSATTKRSLIPFLYKELLRFLISKLGELAYINSENDLVSVNCIHANPERTVAKLKQENNVILPILSITQTNSDNDDNRRRNDHMIITEKVWDDDKQRALRVISLAPRPVNVSYGINVWSKYKSDSDQLSEQIRLLFNPSLVLASADSKDAGIAFINGEEDNSTITTGDREDRVIKKSFIVNVETYIPNPKFLITATGKIEEFHNEFKLC